MKFLSLTIFVFALFTSCASANDDDLFMRKGLETLYLQEAEKYLVCIESSADPCQFSEVEGYLELLDLKKPKATVPVNYPRSAQESGLAGVVDNLISIRDDGSVENVEALSCKSGKGDTGLQLNWKTDGRHCRMFMQASVKALSEWEFNPLPESLQKVPRKLKWRVTFALAGKTSEIINAQITDLKSSQARKIQKFTKAKDWPALETYALKNIEKNPVFRYYAADSAWMLGNHQLSIERYKEFLENGGYSYWHFGTKAAAVVIPHLYRAGNDKEVVKVGRPSLLERYLREGNAISKPAVAESLIFYATSLMFQEKPEIAEAFTLFKSLKQYGRRYGGITTDQMRVINEQITNLEAQIIKIGKTKAKQLSDPVKLG